MVIIRFPGGRVEKFEEVFARNEDTITAISAEGRGKGALHHLFAVDENGDVLVVDEWGSVAEFEDFFNSQQDIQKVIAELELTGQPTVLTYPILDTSDRF
jgi:hypothetical protein